MITPRLDARPDESELRRCLGVANKTCRQEELVDLIGIWHSSFFSGKGWKQHELWMLQHCKNCDCRPLTICYEATNWLWVIEGLNWIEIDTLDKSIKLILNKVKYIEGDLRSKGKSGNSEVTRGVTRGMAKKLKKLSTLTWRRCAASTSESDCDLRAPQSWHGSWK